MEKNNNKPKEIPKEILEKLVTDQDIETRVSVANDPKTPKKILEKLANK